MSGDTTSLERSAARLLSWLQAQTDDFDTELLEAWAFASQQQRRNLLSKYSPGTETHFLLTALLAEQEGYPADLEATLKGLISDMTDKNTRWHWLTPTAKQYLFRRGLHKFTGEFTEGDEEPAGLLTTLKETLRPSTSNWAPHVEEDEKAALRAAIDAGQDPVALALAAGAKGGAGAAAASATGPAPLPELPDDTPAAAPAATSSFSSSTPPSPDSYVTDADTDIDARIATALKAAFEAQDKDYKHSYPAIVRPLGGAAIAAWEHPAVLEAALTNDAAAYGYLSATERAPEDDDGKGIKLLKKVLTSSWVADHYSHMPARLAARVFPALTLQQLKELKASLSSWFSKGMEGEENLAWLQAVVARLTPPSHVDLRSDGAAVDAYLSALSEVLADVSADKKSLNALRVIVAFHRLRRAYETARTYTAPAAREALLDFLKVPLQGAPWTKNDASGFFKSISTARFLASATSMWEVQSYASADAKGTVPIALPAPTKEDLVATITDALKEICGAEAGAKPGAKASSSASGLQPWEGYVSETWLRKVQAEGRLLTGSVADPMAWASLLADGSTDASPAACERALAALRERQEVAFARCNPEFLAPGSELAVTLVAKGLKGVTLRLFELNTTGIYASNGNAEIASDLDLDGLVPHYTADVALGADGALGASGGSAAGGVAPGVTFHTPAPARGAPFSPFQQHRFTVRLPSASSSTSAPARGVWVVEAVGGGQSLRTVVRIGALRCVEQLTAAGQLITITDEANAPLPADRVSVSVGGKTYTAASPGSSGGGILVPFAATTATKPLALTLHTDSLTASGSGSSGSGGDGASSGWSFTSLVPGWTHRAESYTLEAAFYVDREALLKDSYGATLLVRPKLLLAGRIAAPLRLLANAALTITSTDADGLTSSRTHAPFPLNDDAESAVAFAVPPGLRSLKATLTGEVTILATGVPSKLSASSTLWSVNGIDGTSDTRDVHLRHCAVAGRGWEVLLLGKTGEPCADVSVDLSLAHPWLREPLHLTRRTDASGAIALGALRGYTSVTVSGYSTTGADGSGGRSGTAVFDLPPPVFHAYPTEVHTTTAGAPYGAAAAAAAAAGTETTATKVIRKASKKAARKGYGLVNGEPVTSLAVQAAVPFFPSHVATSLTASATPSSSSSSSSSSHYLPSRTDVTLYEVRPTPAAHARLFAGAGTGAKGGLTAATSDGLVSSLPVTDYTTPTHLSYDAASGCLLVRSLPAGEYRLVVKKPHPAAAEPAPPVTIRVLPAPGSSAATRGDASVVGGSLCGGSVALQLAPARPVGAPAARATASAAAATAADSKGVDSEEEDDDEEGDAVTSGAGASGRGGPAPLQITGLALGPAAPGGPDSLTIRVAGGAAGFGGSSGGAVVARDVRVHVFVSFFAAPWDAASALASVGIPGLAVTRWSPPRTRYLPGRVLGEEARYIVERRRLLAVDAAAREAAGPAGGATQAILPGNSLARPSLLLNPWSLGPVFTDVQEAKEGTAYASVTDRAGGSATGGMAAKPAAPRVTAGAHNAHLSQDFLARPSNVLLNLRPDPATGALILTLPELLGDKAAAAAPAWDLQIRVVAVDAVATAAAWATLPGTESRAAAKTAAASLAAAGKHGIPAAAAAAALPSAPARPFRDLTVSGGAALALEAHFARQSRVKALVAPGESVDVVSGGTFVRIEPCASWERAAAYLASVAPGDVASAFKGEWEGPLTAWARSDATERRATYSKAASHELHLFAFFRDYAAFFKPVIAPFLACKRTRSFVDHWLLGDDLSAYASAHVLDRLNALECGLLAAWAAFTGQDALASALVQGLTDAVEASPVPPAVQERLFKAALAADALGGSGGPGGASIARASAPPPPMTRAAPRMVGGPMPPPSFGGPPMAAMMSMMAPPSAACPPPPPPPCPAPGAPPMARRMAAGPRAMRADAEREQCAVYEQDVDELVAARGAVAASSDAFRALDKTEELTETHYWKVRPGTSTAGLVAPSPFWRDFAAHAATVGAAARAASSAAAFPDAFAAAWATAPFVPSTLGTVAPDASLNALLAALAVVSLPHACDPEHPPAAPTVTLLDGGSRVRYTCSGTPLLLYYQELVRLSDAASAEAASSGVLVGQSYSDPSDASRVNAKGVRVDRYLEPTHVRGGRPVLSVVPGKVYNASVVVTNTTSSSQALEVMLTIPQGALPASSGFFSRTSLVTLSPYSTTRLSYAFYFPRPGTFGHYPAHATATGTDTVVAYATPVFFAVLPRRAFVVTPTSITWRAVAVGGRLEHVVAWLSSPATNLATLELQPMLWRLEDKAAYTAITAALRTRQRFDPSVWGYAFLHKDVAGVKEYLAQDEALSRLTPLLGRLPTLRSPLLNLAPEEGVPALAEGGASADQEALAAGIADRLPLLTKEAMGVYGRADSARAGWYAHLEYSPLVNARAHVLGDTRKILNKTVEKQYQNLLVGLGTKPAGGVTAADTLAVVYHLLLQDRVADARRVFSTVPAPRGSVAAAASRAAASGTPVSPSVAAAVAGGGGWLSLQYDYAAAYLDFFNLPPAAPSATAPYPYPIAAAVAAAYAAYPVPRWAARFKEIQTQLVEAGWPPAGLAAAAGTRGPRAAHGTGAGDDETGAGVETTREARMTAGAAREPALEVVGTEAGAAALRLTAANVTSVTLRLYLMDLETLFSTSPFLVAGLVGSGGTGAPTSTGATDATAAALAASASLGRFALVRPNFEAVFEVSSLAQVSSQAGAPPVLRLPLPAAAAGANALVELSSPQAPSLRRVVPLLSSRLTVTVAESAGRLKVTAPRPGAPADAPPLPLPRAYVKVFARASASSSSASFFKDGYTDLRGVFDYATLSTSGLSEVGQFAALVTHPAGGAAVLLVAPPPQ